MLAGKPHLEALQDMDPALHALLRTAFPAVILPAANEERPGIVAELARRRGVKTTDEVCRYVAERFGESFGRLESTIPIPPIASSPAPGSPIWAAPKPGTRCIRSSPANRRT